MNISIPDPAIQNLIFEIILGLAMIVSAHILIKVKFLDPEQTNELKGFAILAVIFSHIGFFMFNSQAFLQPLSWLSGVGVNLFLFLSGYGLTLSSLNRPVSRLAFYRKRLLRLFIPLWIVLISFYLIDWVFLHRSYSTSNIFQSLIGFYPSAHLWNDLNSPLWYFTIILFFYLIFPIVYLKRWPYLSPLLMILISWLVLSFNLPVKDSVRDFYHLHYLAFPLGTLFGIFHTQFPNALSFRHPILRYGVLLSAFMLFCYFTVHSGINTTLDQEQTIGLINMSLVIIIFWLLPVRLRLLSIFGQYSYELYLLHWPIISRYSNLYQIFPAAIATIIYLAALLGLSIILQKLVKRLPT